MDRIGRLYLSPATGNGSSRRSSIAGKDFEWAEEDAGKCCDDGGSSIDAEDSEEGSDGPNSCFLGRSETANVAG